MPPIHRADLVMNPRSVPTRVVGTFTVPSRAFPRDFTDIVKRSRQAQGLPDHVSDPDTLRRIAQILQTGAACLAATQREAVARGRSTDSTSNKGKVRRA